MEKMDSKQGYAEIHTGEVEIVTGFDYIVHKINPKSLQDILETIKSERIKPYCSLDAILNKEISDIEGILHSIRPDRTKRSLFDGVGTALKWVFGTLDVHDRQNIQAHFAVEDKNMHAVVEGINQQIHVNNNFNESIANLKNFLMSDRQEIRNQLGHISQLNVRIVREELATRQLLKLQLLKQQAQHIQDNVVAARTGIPRPGILTRDEIEKFDINFEKLRNMGLGMATYMDDILVFIVKIPTRTSKMYKRMLLPVPTSLGEQVNEEIETVVEHEGRTYTFEAGKSIFELKHSRNCIVSRKCELVRNLDEEIIEIEENIIIMINANKIQVSSTCDDRKWNATGHLFLSFQNCSIQIGHLLFTNRITEYIQKYVLPKESEIIGTTSIPNFQDIVLRQEASVKEIKELKFHRTVTGVTGGVGLLLIAGVLSAIIYLFKKVRKERSEGVKRAQKRDILSEIKAECQLESV